ncbi:MAG TPA: peptidoglycan-binding domain-containing protein [Gaiellaceae bacterium]|nr:peptidoglycan-binding domain-containing protein [Gaiellaceae bacterium]
MASGGPHRAGDSDDWFADVEPAGALESDPPSAEDDWLVPLEPEHRAVPDLPWRRIAIVGGSAVVLLLAGLAAGGVFSSSSSTPPALTITSVSVSQPATTVKTTSSVSALPTATSKPGDTGAQVRALQRALKSLGYQVGTIDGQYGPTTKAAVAAFQQTAGLTADGVFGPKTLNALIQRAGP